MTKFDTTHHVYLLRNWLESSAPGFDLQFNFESDNQYPGQFYITFAHPSIPAHQKIYIDSLVGTEGSADVGNYAPETGEDFSNTRCDTAAEIFDAIAYGLNIPAMSLTSFEQRKTVALRMNGVALAWFTDSAAAVKAAELVKHHLGTDFSVTWLSIYTASCAMLLRKHELDYLLHIYPDVFNDSMPYITDGGSNHVTFKVSQDVYDAVKRHTVQITITTGRMERVLDE